MSYQPAAGLGSRGIASSSSNPSERSTAAQLGADTTNAADSLAETRKRKRALRKSMAAKLDALVHAEVTKQSQGVTRRLLQSTYWENANSISIYVSMQSGEVITDELCAEALQQGKKLYVPLFAAPLPPTPSPSTQAATNPQPGPSALLPPSPATAKFATDMRMLRLRSQAEFNAMKSNRWGIREPEELYSSANTIPAEEGQERQAREDALQHTTGGRGLDLILAPGVAFDTAGGRLGHGKGYYDRYIARTAAFNKECGRPAPVVVALALDAQIFPGSERVPSDENDLPMTAIVHSKGWIYPASASNA